MTKDGKINGKDMIFEFSGVDDGWVYIDGHLALDIGGNHGEVAGSINFAKKESIVDKVKNPALASKVAGSQMILSQQEAEKAIRNSKRTLMHIVDKTAQAEAVNNPPIKTQKEEGGWWSRHWWKVLIGVLIATTIGILGFRKGGWWNKRPKINPPVVPTPGQTSSPLPTTGRTLDPSQFIEPVRTDTPGHTSPAPTPAQTTPAPAPTPAQTTSAPQTSPLGQTVSTSAQAGFTSGFSR
jgi:hypothetical protein